MVSEGNTSVSSRVLVSPLDWGLGHATRCIPIINHLLALEMEPIVAASGGGAEILKQEFPHLHHLSAPGMPVRYSKSESTFGVAMLRQMVPFRKLITLENRWLAETVRVHNIHYVISDNRYGMYHPEVPSAIIAHQLGIKSGMGKTGDSLLQKVQKKHLQNFDQCWVPDCAGSENLGGELSHPVDPFPIATHYLGPLSRFATNASVQPQPGRVLCIISGPEPQRTLLENLLLEQASTRAAPTIIVRGLPGSLASPIQKEGVKIFNHLPTSEMLQEICKAEFVVARSGYSTVMDLCQLKAKAIYIPTPGQPEQAYLAQHLASRRYATTQKQSGFDLLDALTKARLCAYEIPSELPQNFSAISHWLWKWQRMGKES